MPLTPSKRFRSAQSVSNCKATFVLPPRLLRLQIATATLPRVILPYLYVRISGRFLIKSAWKPGVDATLLTPSFQQPIVNPDLDLVPPPLYPSDLVSFQCPSLLPSLPPSAHRETPLHPSIFPSSVVLHTPSDVHRYLAEPWFLR